MTSTTTNQQLSGAYSYFTLPGRSSKTTESSGAATNIVQLLKHKTENNFSHLYDNYASALFSVIYRIVMNKEIAEDLLQDTFVKIWKSSDRYDDTKGTPYTWMLNIARNTGIDFIRVQKNNFYKKMLSTDLLVNEPQQPLQTVHRIDRLDYVAVKNKTSLLEKKYADVINLIYFEVFTQEQVADILGLPLGTVKTRSRMALSILKNKCK